MHRDTLSRDPSSIQSAEELVFPDTFKKLAERAPVSLGKTVVEANGYDSLRAPTYVVQNFIPSVSTSGGLPLQIDATPNSNKSANQLSIPCLQDNELAITTVPAPGLLSYFVDRTLLESKDQVISVNGKITEGRQQGFPGFDPMSQALEGELIFDQGYLVSAFTSEFIREQAQRMGLTGVQRSDSRLTNDKLAFMTNAEKYGYRVCDFFPLKSPEDVLNAVTKYRNEDVWVKFSHAFGGDLLFKVPNPVTMTQIYNAVSKIHSTVASAFKQNNYSPCNLFAVWPELENFPSEFGITVEKDARWISGGPIPGEIVLTGSNLMEVRADGSTIVHSDFEQIIGPEGEFLGSQSFSPEELFGSHFSEELNSQMKSIGQYCSEELKLFGLVGVDYVVIRDPKGDLVPVMIELNGRPPISACSHIIGTEKLGAAHWVSRYVWAPVELTSFDDFRKLVTIDGKDLSAGNPEEGIVVPMYLASVFQKEKSGKVLPLIKKRWGQCLVAADSQEKCLEIFNILEERSGFSYTMPSTPNW